MREKVLVHVARAFLALKRRSYIPTNKRAVQEKGEKSEGIRGTAEAEWKKRNTLERPLLKYLHGSSNFGRRFAFGMEPYRNDPSASDPTNLERFLLFPPLHDSPSTRNSQSLLTR
ncbi:hypothetical protein AN963_01510 [Brevibacillus choshinensis]|uniref:Uncharacterized protein n=1 Tax=Brevibacillus choshinensis TaxID=54911 RepID=A0ABR5NAD8_BRECH|nr:hypothetical protein AN963_01510 [Brevibacillus choshinensis]